MKAPTPEPQSGVYSSYIMQAGHAVASPSVEAKNIWQFVTAVLVSQPDGTTRNIYQVFNGEDLNSR